MKGSLILEVPPPRDGTLQASAKLWILAAPQPKLLRT
jgi:hypothetical protein